MCNNCNQNNCNECTNQEVHICNQCPPETCDCPIVDLSADCVLYTGDDIECNSVVVVPKNTKVSDAFSQTVSWYCTKFAELANNFRIINTGVGAAIYSGNSLIGEKRLRRLKSTNGSVTITEGIDDINLSVIVATPPDGSETKVTAGTSISVAGNGTIATPYIVNNTAPDQVVTIAAGTNIVVSGIYPSFTVAQTAESILDTKKEFIVVTLSDLITNLTTGITKAYFRMPFTATVNLVSASVVEAQTAGSLLTFDINENGTSILSTKLTIDNTEKTSITATTPPVISDTTLTYDSEITFDIDQVGTAGAKGAVITLSLTRA
jgi:hypothetical protein